VRQEREEIVGQGWCGGLFENFGVHVFFFLFSSISLSLQVFYFVFFSIFFLFFVPAGLLAF
jgi:hypothetical protein